jgi:protein-L-isoaspartate(D-aspartate) O-methyltransferase
MNKFKNLRKQMIEYQLIARDLRDQEVLNTVGTLQREEFIPADLVEFAYSDSPLPIAANQTISQPTGAGNWNRLRDNFTFTSLQPC